MRIFSFVVLLLSCSKKQAYFTENEVLVKDFFTSVKLEGDVFLEDDSAGVELLSLDSFLILMPARNTHFFYVFNNSSGNFIGSFGTKGQGPNELASCIYSGQTFIKQDTVALWINDVNGGKVCLIDVGRSLKQKACFFVQDIKVPPRSLYVFINDDCLLSEELRSDNYYWNKINLSTGDVNTPEAVYLKNVNNTFSTYKSLWRMNPAGTYLAGAMKSINQINILDLKSGEKKSLIINKPVSPVDELLDVNTNLEHHRYYCDLAVTDSFIYALFMDQPYEDAFEKEKEVEIHVFSWEGKPLARYIIPHYLRAFTVNESKHIFYGLSLDGKVYRYQY